jgi:hypothetical protein
MSPRGQTALDLLLGLLVLLIILNAFSGVLTRFEEVQKEMSIRQQLRENLFLIRSFTEYSSSFAFDQHIYPKTNSLPQGTLVVDYVNYFTRSFGTVELKPVRAVGVQSYVPCLFTHDVNVGIFLAATALPADTFLPYTVDVNTYGIIKEGYDSNHSFIVDGCFNYFSIGALP